MECSKLDNPVWNSLGDSQQQFSIDYIGIKFYKPDYCPFGGFINIDSTKSAIDNYAILIDNFYIVGNKPIFNNKKINLKNELICDQMLLEKPINVEIHDQIIALQTEQQKLDLYALVNYVQPGYFNKKTSEIGSYYGIYKQNKLVAVTGERMKMQNFTEISAIITHPAHTGKGYAKQLITHTSNKIFNENKIPYLHVIFTNIKAIGLYQNLGFRTRRKISFWNFVINR